MSKSGLEPYIVRHPDFIPEGEEHLYPAMGGVFHDFIPEGKTRAETYGEELDDTRTPPVTEVSTKTRRKNA